MEELEKLKDILIKKYEKDIAKISYRIEDKFEFKIFFKNHDIMFVDKYENLDIEKLEKLIDEYITKNIK